MDTNRGHGFALEWVVTARCSIGILESYNVGVKLGVGDRNVYRVLESIQRSRKGRVKAVNRRDLAAFFRISVHALNAHLRKLLKAGLLIRCEVALGRDLICFEVNPPPGHREGTCPCVRMKMGREHHASDPLASKCPASFFSAPGISPRVSELALYIFGVVGSEGTMHASIETYAEALGCSMPTVNRLLPGLRKLGFMVVSGQANYNCNRITVPRFANTSSQSSTSPSLDTSALEAETKTIDGGTEMIDHGTKTIDERRTKMIHLEDTGILEDQDNKKIKTVEDISERARGDAALPAKEPSSSQGSKRRPHLTPLPDDFTLTPELRRFASEHHVNPDRAFERFTNHSRATGARKANWAAAFRVWVLNAQRMEIDRYDVPPPLRSFNDAPLDPAVRAANLAKVEEMVRSMNVGPQAVAVKATEAETADDPDWSIDRSAATLTNVATAAEVKFERAADAGKAAPPSVE